MEMNNIFATIKWMSAAEGGRKKALDIGIKYFPTITLDEDSLHTHWSVSFVTSPINSDGSSNISFCLLIDNDDTRRIEKLLVAGTKFCFCEGSKVVAKGIVTG